MNQIIFLTVIFSLIKYLQIRHESLTMPLIRGDSWTCYQRKTKASCYKTFKGSDLQIYLSVCPDKPFQPSLLFASKTFYS
jgi:hypothetical protein